MNMSDHKHTPTPTSDIHSGPQPTSHIVAHPAPYSALNSTPRSAPHSAPHSAHGHSKSTQFHHVLAGATSAAFTRCICQPLDVLKIRFQLQVEPIKISNEGFTSFSSSKYTSLRQAYRLIFKEEGLFAFWKGHISGQCQSISNGIAQFWVYEQLHLSAKQMQIFQGHPNLSNLVCGSISGCFATTISMPFDVVRTRLVGQDHGSEQGYKNLRHAFKTIYRTEGVPGLFRGTVPSLIHFGPMTGLNFMFYKYFNQFSASLLNTPRHHLPFWCILLTGCCAGISSKLVVYPFDFLRKRMQIQGFENQRKTFGRHMKYSGLIDCIRTTLREEGVLGFYKGLAPTVLKAGLMTALFFTSYDELKRYMNE